MLHHRVGDNILVYFCAMGKFFYKLSLALYNSLVWLVAPFNLKAKQMHKGRAQTWANLRDFNPDLARVLWVHCASLGEFEQGRPIIEAYRTLFPEHKVLLSFYSPSGYEIRKNYELADCVVYLPSDSEEHASLFVDLAKPSVAIFVKYEFWHFYLETLRERKIPVLSVSAIFRKEQLFFKELGGFYRAILKNMTHFFVQNENSRALLASIDISNVSVVGDTRFDRVRKIVESVKEIEVAKKFKGNSKIMVVGSSWKEDLEVLGPWYYHLPDGLKLMVAPHDISEASLKEAEGYFGDATIRFSKAQEADLDSFKVLLIDNMGMLSSLYQYGDFAYIGGAFGKGLHNTLEAATFGLPVFFGDKNYKKFSEAVSLIEQKGAFTIHDSAQLKRKFDLMWSNEAYYAQTSEICKEFVRKNTGATDKIMEYLTKLLADEREGI